MSPWHDVVMIVPDHVLYIPTMYSIHLLISWLLKNFICLIKCFILLFMLIFARWHLSHVISNMGSQCFENSENYFAHILEQLSKINKANLRDLIAATGLVILLKLDSNRWLFARVTLKFDGWPRKIIRHVFYTTSNFVYHFISISEFKLELQSGNAQSGSN